MQGSGYGGVTGLVPIARCPLSLGQCLLFLWLLNVLLTSGALAVTDELMIHSFSFLSLSASWLTPYFSLVLAGPWNPWRSGCDTNLVVSQAVHPVYLVLEFP